MIRFREAISVAFLGVKTMVAEVDTQKREAGPGLATQSQNVGRRGRKTMRLKAARVTRRVPNKPGLHMRPCL